MPQAVNHKRRAKRQEMEEKGFKSKKSYRRWQKAERKKSKDLIIGGYQLTKAVIDG